MDMILYCEVIQGERVQEQCSLLGFGALLKPCKGAALNPQGDIVPLTPSLLCCAKHEDNKLWILSCITK